MEEAEKADLSKDYILLENPEVKEYLDELLLKKFWPFIRSNLEGRTLIIILRIPLNRNLN